MKKCWKWQNVWILLKNAFFEDEDTSNISFQVLSDVHIEGKSENLETVKIFKDALQDIRYLDPDSSAIMIPEILQMEEVRSSMNHSLI